MQIWLSAAHIAGKVNVIADDLSRNFNDDLEWSLCDDEFNKLLQQFGHFSIDLFATCLNTKVKRFCSWSPQPGAEWIDAFTRSWTDEFFYAFPPSSLTGRVLQKARRDQARGVIVAHDWKSQPFYSQLVTLARDTLVIKTTPRTLTLSHDRERVHPLAGKLRLLVVLL